LIEDGFERVCATCGSVSRQESSSCRRCGYDLMDALPEEQERTTWLRLEQPLASMRVYRREIGMSLILFGFGFLLLAGGWTQAYFGGMWRLSAPTLVGGYGMTDASLAIFTNYAQCAGLVASSNILDMMFGPLAGHASCSLHSLDPSGLTFVGLGGTSMVVGLVAAKKRFLIVGRRISAFWWVLALAIPLVGGIIAYLGVREKNRTSAINMVLLGVEVLFGSALLYILTGFPLTAL
jgi:hypothetical protein